MKIGQRYARQRMPSMTIQDMIDHLNTFKNKQATPKLWLVTATGKIPLTILNTDNWVSDDMKRAYIADVGC